MATNSDAVAKGESTAALDAANKVFQNQKAGTTELNGKTLVPPSTVQEFTLDREWAKTAFIVSDAEIGDATDIQNRYWSSASAKFTDSRLGCNIGINPRPQWTPYADIRVKGRLRGREKVRYSNASGNYGQGRAWSESQDDPAQKVYFRFGVPQFNSLTTFLLRAFDREQMIFARTGRAPSAFYSLAKAAGTIIPAVAFPWFTVTVMVGKALNWLFSRPTSKFFTIKPTMHLYWATVSHMVNNHAVNEGVFKKVFSDDPAQRLSKPYKLDEEQVKQITDLMPDVFNGHNFFDIYAIANRAQVLANHVFMTDFENLDNGSNTDFVGYLKRENTGGGVHGSYISTPKGRPSLAAILNEAAMAGNYETDGKELKQELDPRVVTDSKDPNAKPDPSHLDKMKTYFDAEVRDGAEFAVFRVDHTGSIGEAFSNQVGESDLGQKLNGISSQFREARFSFADGNIVGGVIGDGISAVTNAAIDVATGVLDGVTLGFSGLIPGLGGSGYIDIPKHWQSSSTQLPTANYTIQLISPFNNPISRMINIWIPYYMVLAGVVPKSTGKQSYTSPYYCQVFDRGRLQSRCAMITGVRITRGTTNLPFDTEGKVLGIDLSIEVTDLSSIMHMPMSSGELLGTDMTVDEDNIAADYLNVLAGMDIYSQIYPLSKAQLKLSKELIQKKSKIFSPAFHASVFKNTILPGPIVNVIESMVRGNAGTEGPLR